MNIVQQAGGKTQLPSLPVPELNKTLENVTGQVLSSTQRLQSAGVDTTKVTETRNPLEQALNLTPDQNFLFDIMEVVNRPQQALFGAITALQTGKDVGKEALKGFTGQQDYYGGEIVRNMAGLKEDGSIDWTDFAGFALDVVLDPADLALAFVTGGASTIGIVADTTADALKVADTAIDASKVVGTLGDDVAEGLTKGAKAVANKINIPEALQDTFLGKGNRLYKPADAGEYLRLVADKNFRKLKGVQEASLTSLVMKSLGAGFKVGTALTDSIVESTLAKVDVDGKSLGVYKAVKDAFKKSANDMGAYVKRAVSASGERYNTVMEQLAPSYNKFTSYVQETARKTGLPEDVVAVRGMRAYEYHYLKDRNLAPTKFLDFITGTKYKYLPDSEDTLTSIRIIFGEEAVSKIERVTIDDMPVLKFDETYWSKANKSNISRLGTGVAKVDVMKKADINASEKALKAKDPEAFANYEAQKKAYNAELNERVKKQYAQQYPEDFKPKTVAQRQKLLGSIKTKLMKEDIQAGRGIQKVLQEMMPSDEVGSYFYANSKVREYDIKTLNLENESIARSIKKDLDLQVDKAVEGRYPSSGEPKGLVEKKQYYKDRAKFASELRKELYETELDPFIRKKLPESYKPASYQKAKAKLKEAIAGDSAETVAQQVPVDNLEETIQLADAGNAYPEGELVKIGTFYTPEQIQALEADLAQDWVKDFVTKYDEVITNTQKIIGQSEFGDASSLINQSIKGYTTHTPARETKEVFEKIKKEFRAKEMDYSFFAPGSTSSLKSREYLGSALEANNFRRAYYKEMLKSDEWLKTQLSEIDDEAVKAMEEYFDMDLFSEDARTSLGTMMTKVYGSMNYNHRTTEMAIAMSFGKAGSETSAFRVLGRNDGIPNGYTKIANDEVAKLRNTLTQTRKYTGKGMFIDSLIKTLDEGLADKNMAVMETHLYNMLVATKGKSAESAWELVDMFNKTFKVGKTLSPSFNMKNLFGLASNQWLSGVLIQDIFKNWNKSVDGYKKMVAVNDKVIKMGFEALTEEESKLYTVYKEFLDAGFMSKQTIYRLNDLEDTGVYKLTEDKLSKSKVDSLINNPVTRANMEMNVWADNRARLGLYMYAKENPDYLRKLGFDPERADSAMKAVRMVLFDPNDLTFFEDDVMKRLIPFYTFTRQNLAFQMKNLAKNSDKYYKLYKAYNAWNKEIMGLDKEDMAKYQRDQFYVPIFSKKDGSYVALKTSLPVSALTEITLNPQELLQNVVSKTTPLIKAPFEMATGTNTFTGQPIQNYQGEPSKNILGVSKGTEWLLSQVGADVPLRGASGVLNTIGSLAKGKPQDALGSLFEQTANATGNIDPYQNQVSKQYQQLNALNDKIKALKASGKTVPTISELTSKQKNDELATRASDMKKITDMINNIKR